jgi:hypothetical protein
MKIKAEAVSSRPAPIAPDAPSGHPIFDVTLLR